MIDIVIPHFGSDRLLDKCLASISQNTDGYNVIVVDNNEDNRGFAKACNEGIKQGSSEYVVLLNNDTEVSAGWAERLTTILEIDQRVGVIGPLSTASSQWQWIHNVGRILDLNLPKPDYVTNDIVQFPGNLAFWCAAFRRETLDDVGLLDEQFFMYCEDDDWCMRAKKKGYVQALDLGTVVQHRHRTNYSAEVQAIHAESWQKLKEKWGIRESPRILVGILNQGDIRTELANQMIRWTQPRNDIASIDIYFPNDKPIAQNRNGIVMKFLDGNFTHLFMCDNDVVPRGDPLSMASLNLDVIGLPCPIFNTKKLPKEFLYANVARHLKEQAMWQPFRWPMVNRGIMEVEAVGTGAILIARRVLEHPALRGPFMRSWDEDGIAQKGLDFYFCERARAAGFRIFVHTGMPCDHLLTVPVGQFLELAERMPYVDQMPKSGDAQVAFAVDGQGDKVFARGTGEGQGGNR